MNQINNNNIPNNGEAAIPEEISNAIIQAINGLETRTNQRINATNQRINALETRINQSMNALEGRLVERIRRIEGNVQGIMKIISEIRDGLLRNGH